MKQKQKENISYFNILQNEKNNKRAGMHSFHRYYGKLIPAIPATFIKEFTNEEELIFDPFTGSGTTAVEAKRLNRYFLGTEINPLSTLISKVKTANYDSEKLNFYNNLLVKQIDILRKNKKLKIEKYPFVINRDHWFKDFVQKDMKIIQIAINKIFTKYQEDLNYIYFYHCVLSAIIRNISNADNKHVFPGISKRMRRLEKEGKINIDVFSTFNRAIIKRAKYYDVFKNKKLKSEILNKNILDFNTQKYNNMVDLIVTNPPYISSVRYIETMKLEMYWLEFIKDQNEYSMLAKKMFGNDRLNKKDYENVSYTNYKEINKIINKMILIDKKSAKIISDFFNNMEKTIIKMNDLLKTGKKAVIKISDSKMKKEKIETGKLLSMIAEKNGFRIIDIFKDEINNNSRYLTTARNTYSDIITHDYILIWEKA